MHTYIHDLYTLVVYFWVKQIFTPNLPTYKVWFLSDFRETIFIEIHYNITFFIRTSYNNNTLNLYEFS